MNVVLGVVVGMFILFLAIWIIRESRCVKWYKVYMANDDVKLLKRDFKERMWRTSDRYMRFKDEYGREVTFPAGAHWILMWEEVDSGELDIVREQIKRMKEDMAEEHRNVLEEYK